MANGRTNLGPSLNGTAFLGCFVSRIFQKNDGAPVPAQFAVAARQISTGPWSRVRASNTISNCRTARCRDSSATTLGGLQHPCLRPGLDIAACTDRSWMLLRVVEGSSHVFEQANHVYLPGATLSKSLIESPFDAFRQTHDRCLVRNGRQASQFPLPRTIPRGFRGESRETPRPASLPA